MDTFKKQLLIFLKGEFIKIALKKLLGSVAFGGFKGWIVKFIATELFEEVAEPMIKFAIRKGMLVADKVSGNIKVSKYEKAKEDGDESGYTDSIGSV